MRLLEVIKINKQRFKVVVIFTITILLTILIYFNKKDSLNISQTKPTLTPVIFNLKGVVPANGIGARIFETTAIDFQFSKPIDLKSLSIKIEPETEFVFETDFNNRNLFIKAVPWWEIGVTYTIFINVQSDEGDSLNEIKYDLRIDGQEDEGISESFSY